MRRVWWRVAADESTELAEAWVGVGGESCWISNLAHAASIRLLIDPVAPRMQKYIWNTLQYATSYTTTNEHDLYCKKNNYIYIF